MNNFDSKLARERKTIATMVNIYCQLKHRSNKQLCPECQELNDYAMLRLEKCPFQAQKPNCADCKIHCYQKEKREMIKEVMRIAGPRMLLRHPILALLHLKDAILRKRNS